MSPALVSIVIPCYNAERYLDAAIESALSQDYPAVETIVVDDGSTDGSWKVAAAFGDRIRLITQPNRGLSAARNSAIGAARGEYVLLLDADDVLRPTCVESRIQAFRSDPSLGLVAGYYREIDERGEIGRRIPEPRRVGPLPPFRQAVRRNWGPPVGWTFRREVIDRCGPFDPSLGTCADWDFVIRVSRHYRIGYVPTIETFYRRHDTAMSRNFALSLDELARLQAKNRNLATNALEYWLDCRFGEFELGRRAIYESARGSRLGPALANLTSLVRRKPALIWIGLLAAGTYLTGKRASSPADLGGALAVEGR